MFGRRALPAWSPFEDVDVHREFVRLVRRELARTGLRYRAEDDGRVIVFRDRPVRLDVDTLAAEAVRADPVDWVAMVAGRVGAVLDPRRLPEDPEVLRGMVRVRLISPDALADLGGIDLVTRRHSGLVEVVAVDTRTTVIWGEAPSLAVLGLDEAGLLELGRANVREHDEPAVRAMDVADGTVIAAAGDSFFVASWALFVDELVPLPAAGAVLGVPDRHTLLVTPLDGPEAAGRIDAMVAPTVDRFSTAAGSISPHLHLWQDGALSIQPVVRRDDGSLGLVPGPQLVTTLARLES